MRVALVRHTNDRFTALIGATATVRDLAPSLVEKDYWEVEALRAVQGGFDVIVGEVTLHVQPIFKCGTSLSTAFGLIERFSEDIDLLVPVPAADPKDFSTKAPSSRIEQRLRGCGIGLPAPGNPRCRRVSAHPQRAETSATGTAGAVHLL